MFNDFHDSHMEFYDFHDFRYNLMKLYDFHDSRVKFYGFNYFHDYQMEFYDLHDLLILTCNSMIFMIFVTIKRNFKIL